MRALLALLLVASPLPAQLVVRLAELPAGTPSDASVHIAGTFNGWNPGHPDWRLRPAADGQGWSITLPPTVRGPVEFKLTLGSWETGEATVSGEDAPNRAVVVPDTGTHVITVRVAAWRRPGAARPSTRTATVRVLAESLPMPQLGRTRRVWVYLPADYARTTRRYPVLYLHDGQNVFDAATSYAGEWGVDETLDSLLARGAPAAIVVAADHGGDRRLDEYNPWKARDPRHGGGEGEAYVRWLVETLKPAIDARFRTLPGPAHTGILGSSMGGLVSLYAAVTRPDVFGRAGVFSCACWIADPQVYELAARARLRPDARVYFLAGGAESPDGSVARDQRRVVDALRAAGVPASSVRDVVRPDGRHTESFWRREFASAFRWLFAEPLRKP